MIRPTDPDLDPSARAASAHGTTMDAFADEHRTAISSGEPIPGFSERLPFVEVTQLDAMELPPVPLEGRTVGRTRVRLRLWRLAAELRIEQNAATGELMARRNRTAASVAGLRKISPDAALEIARGAVEIPPEAAKPIIAEAGLASTPAWEISWFHFVGDNVIVDGDKVSVRVSAVTGEVISTFRKWRTVPHTPPVLRGL
jgi:hypothetical protein